MKKRKMQVGIFWSIVFGIPILCTAFDIYCKSSDLISESDKRKAFLYDGTYWRSIAREQQFKDAGLDEFADIERRNRRKELKKRHETIKNE